MPKCCKLWTLKAEAVLSRTPPCVPIGLCTEANCQNVWVEVALKLVVVALVAATGLQQVGLQDLRLHT